MNLYDFDKTIYNGDSTTNFYKYLFKKYPKLILRSYVVVIAFIKYMFGIYSKTQMKQQFYSLLKYVDVKQEVELFWNKEQDNMNKWYATTHKADDIVISASPEFIIIPICKRLDINIAMASRVDFKTGKYDGINCHGEEKVRRLYESLGKVVINDVYSDSLTDTPIAKLATGQAYLVNKEKLTKWEEYTPSKFKQLKQHFMDPSFFKFLIIGIINTLNSIIIASIFNIILPAEISFVLGYVLSLIISFLLNTYIAFNQKGSIDKFIKFVISYIPNFIIQFLCVLVIINIFNLYPFIAYSIAAIIGIPVTYLCLKIFTYNKK